jgi:hypothetical protein
MPEDGNWQRAYAVTILDMMPIYLAHGKWPEFAEKLKPTSSKYWYSQDIHTAAKKNWGSKFIGYFQNRPGRKMDDCMCPIRSTYVMDLAINFTDQPIPMGDPNTPWFYMVPFVGQDLPSGRKAGPQDCRLYPNRRLILTGEDCKIYDGPAFDWHAQVPIIPLTLDDWVHEPLGFSMIAEAAPLQQASDELLRGSLNKERALAHIGLTYDTNSVALKEANFDPLSPDIRVGHDGSVSDHAFQPILPEWCYKVEASTKQGIDYLNETMDYQMALNQVIALAKARAMKGTLDENALDKLAEGPLVMDISATMEASVCALAYQLKFLAMEYETTARMISWVGFDNVAPGTFDYDPAKLYPSHLPDELVSSGAQGDSKYTAVERARWMARNLHVNITPHTLHEQSQTSKVMRMLAMKQRGAPISWKSIMEASDIPDIPNMEKDFLAEKEQEIQLAARLKAETEAAGLGAPGAGQVKKPEGRPATAQHPPKMETKDGGTRPVVSESSK